MKRLSKTLLVLLVTLTGFFYVAGVSANPLTCTLQWVTGTSPTVVTNQYLIDLGYSYKSLTCSSSSDYSNNTCTYSLYINNKWLSGVQNPTCSYVPTDCSSQPHTHVDPNNAYGQCLPDPVTDCSSQPHTHVDPNNAYGQCIQDTPPSCPAHYTFNTTQWQCIRDILPSCPTHYTFDTTSWQCLQDPQPTCDQNQHAENYLCVADPQPVCDVHQHAENYQCIADPQPSCDQNQHAENYECVADPLPSCGNHQHRLGYECLTDAPPVCDTGYQLDSTGWGCELKPYVLSASAGETYPEPLLLGIKQIQTSPTHIDTLLKIGNRLTDDGYTPIESIAVGEQINPAIGIAYNSIDNYYYYTALAAVPIGDTVLQITYLQSIPYDEISNYTLSLIAQIDLNNSNTYTFNWNSIFNAINPIGTAEANPIVGAVFKVLSFAVKDYIVDSLIDYIFGTVSGVAIDYAQDRGFFRTVDYSNPNGHYYSCPFGATSIGDLENVFSSNNGSANCSVTNSVESSTGRSDNVLCTVNVSDGHGGFVSHQSSVVCGITYANFETSLDYDSVDIELESNLRRSGGGKKNILAGLLRKGHGGVNLKKGGVELRKPDGGNSASKRGVSLDKNQPSDKSTVSSGGSSGGGSTSTKGVTISKNGKLKFSSECGADSVSTNITNNNSTDTTNNNTTNSSNSNSTDTNIFNNTNNNNSGGGGGLISGSGSGSTSDLCDKYPDILACAKPEDAPAQEDLDKDEKNLSDKIDFKVFHEGECKFDDVDVGLGDGVTTVGYSSMCDEFHKLGYVFRAIGVIFALVIVFH